MFHVSKKRLVTGSLVKIPVHCYPLEPSITRYYYGRGQKTDGNYVPVCEKGKINAQTP